MTTTHAAAQTERLLSAHEVGEILQLKVSSIYNAVARGRLPAVRLWEGRRRAVIRFKAEDLREFIESRRTRGTARPKRRPTDDRIK